MTHARYGRMQKGRCVKLDYGHLGCAADVIELMDTRCSGRTECEIRVPDMMLTSTRPCPDDLKPYLEASYQCVKGDSTSYTNNESTFWLKFTITISAQTFNIR